MLRSSKQIFSIFLFLCPSLYALDTALPDDASILAKLKTHVAGKGDVAEREIRRVGNRTIELENFISTEMDPRLAPVIFADFPHWSRWVLPGINDKPTGGTYITQLHALEMQSADKLLATFSFDLPLFRGQRHAHFRLQSSTVKNVFTLTGDLLDSEGTFEAARATLKEFAAEGSSTRCWLYVNGRVQLKSGILYEALPEKLLKREASDRVRIILDNYQKEEQSRRGPASSSNKR